VKSAPAGPGARRSSDRHVRVALLALLLVTFAAYAPVLRHGFVEWDDPFYVTENPHVRAGLTAGSIAWAFTSTQLANWHPLTWLSHMLDVRLFGLAPWGHHLTSLLLHLANTLLLFAALRRLTHQPWRSLAVAALFALHPVHVESVAWVAERKDVLSTAFWFAALWAYARHAERPAGSRLAFVALLFGLGLLAKPMLVTLPLTLLVVDYWPLGRATGGPKALGPLVVEKLPLFAMSLAAGATAWLAQRTFGAVTEVPLAARLATSVLGCFGYLEKTLWPVGLAAFYPYRAHPAVFEVAAKAAVLVTISIAIGWLARWRRYLPAGWLWYLVTLAPVAGLIRIGQQQMADRYTYVPLVGVFVMLVWGVADALAHARVPTRARTAAASVAVLLAATLAIATTLQVATWRDGVTLWEHALAVGGNSTVSQTNLGVALEKAGRYEDAASHLEEAVRLEPRNARAHANLGDVRFALGRYTEAAEAYGEALRLDPGSDVTRQSLAMTHYNSANREWRAGRLDVAVREYREGIRWRPDDAGFHRALGMALAQQGRHAEAVAALQRSLELDPANVFTHDVLAIALFESGDYEGAAREVEITRSRGGTPKPWLVAALAKRGVRIR
jgi:tetratricopeptide (TPR) repeat protein